MVKKNEYPKKSEQTGEHASSNPSAKSGDFHHKENISRSSRPPRENQQRDNNQQKAYQHREFPKRENPPRETQQRENAPRENAPRESHQKNHHRENVQNRDNFKETREPYRQHHQRPAIKPQAEETVEDISTDITRIQKEIELELKEIRSLRLGI